MSQVGGGGVIALGVLLGCSARAPSLETALEQRAHEIHTDDAFLPIRVVHLREAHSSDVVHIYIEGDGYAFTTAGTPSLDPTPRVPVGLQLALSDDSGAEVIYLGRPCQWLSAPDVRCTPARWTDERFTTEVAEAYEALVRSLARQRATKLIGFSGGAWIAAEVAGRVETVQGVYAVAGNLAPNVVNRHHRVPELAVEEGATRRQFPLVYFSGLEDFVIPPKLVAPMLRHVSCHRVVTLDGVAHGKGWVERWPTLLREELPVCG